MRSTLANRGRGIVDSAGIVWSTKCERNTIRLTEVIVAFSDRVEGSGTMDLKSAPVIACLALSGCTAILHPVASPAATKTHSEGAVSASEIASMAEGSRVHINKKPVANYESGIVGTVLKASPQGLALMNCENHGRTEQGVPIVNKLPYINRLFKNTGVGVERVPVLWVSIRDIASLSVIEAPPSNYAAPQIPLDTNDEPYFERIGIDFDFNMPPESAL